MLRAIGDLRYNSKELKDGEEFEPISDSDAFVLKAAGKAEDVAAPKRRYQRRDMQAKH
jgi:hypothetical protein